MLWIRSQRNYGVDTRLCQAQNLYIKENVDRVLIMNNNNVIARYNTIERAIGVLDEIQKFLSPIYISPAGFDDKVLDLSKNENIKLLVKSSGDMYIQQLNDIVYEMPEE